MKVLTLKQTLVLISVICFQFFLLINSMFTVWPEMILYPWLMTKGFVLYTDIINPYFPLLQIISGGFFFIFGSSVVTLKILTYLFILSLDLIMFLSSFRLSKSFVSSIFILITFICLQISFGGNGLWFELAAAPFLLLSIGLIWNRQTTKSVLFSAVFLTIAGFIKQNSFLFIIPIIFLFLASKKYSQILIFLIPLVISLLGLIGVLQIMGLMGDFIAWAIELPLSMSKQPGFVLLPSKRQLALIALLLAPVIAYMFSKHRISQKIFWILTLLISASFAFPRYEDFHLQVLVVFSALMMVFLNKKIQFIYLSLAVLVVLFNLDKTWNKNDRFVDNPTLSLANHIKDLSGEIYLLNSPELSYFYADKLPLKPWGTIFPWYYEDNNLSDRVVQDLENREVEYVISGNRLDGSKYQLGHYIPEKLEIYIDERYEKIEEYESFDILKRK